ncbi:hypothetical protein B0H14DRAFT_2873329 [Mycena olivaceomarginata]|nr:hypothetical protein B0H14DRAFT_2873329 [Mycena olivaceomarginata]
MFDSVKEKEGKESIEGSKSIDMLPPFVQHPPSHTAFASVSLHMGDRLRLLGFGRDIRDLMRNTITSHWPRGLQSESPYHGAHEFKLRGYPWHGHREDGAHARRLMSRTLEALFDAGWVLTIATDISKKVSDLDNLVFRHQAPAPARCDWMCVSFSMGDRLKLIDAPDDMRQAIVELSRRAGLLQRDRPYAGVAGVHEVKMLGYPWLATGGETMAARQFVLNLLSTLEQQGWSVYASIDQKAQGGEGGDLDTWHCCRRQNWTPGLPVYHN